MDPPVTSFWAKLRPYRGKEVESWHPLSDHAADVAACTEALLKRSLIRSRLAHLGGLDALTDCQVDRLCVLAAFHDVGKFNVGFQNKKRPSPPFTADHVGEALAAFGTDAGKRMGEALQLPGMVRWGARASTIEDLLVTVLGHHGRPVRPGGQPTPGAWDPTDELDSFAGIADLRQQVEDWYPGAFAEDRDPLPDPTRFQHAFNGLVTLADWLGSNERFFPYAQEGDGPRIEFARTRARGALRHIGLDAQEARKGLIGRPPRFEQVWPFRLRPAQQLFDEMPTDASSSLSILEAPTGSGKTEAALIWFLRLFSAGEVDGLYFALPTRAAASQMHERVRRAVEQVIPEPASRPPVVRAIPGYLSEDDDDGALLSDFGALWPEEDRRWHYRTWASERPKRYLAGTVAVGTIDQVLLSALAVDHAHLRATSLLRHLLVVDEVHASDAYMSRLLEEVLKRHLGSGGHALLMSATLGERARHRYLDLTEQETSSRQSLMDARGFPYPVVVRSGSESPPEVHPVESVSLSRKEVEVELVAAMQEPDPVARRVLEAADEGARVLVIRNTVRGCRELQRALETASSAPQDPRLFRCEGIVAPHHSRFASIDRRLLDDAVENAFHPKTASGGVALSATQTVEQSLDIDSDLMVTDLCPADVLLQRIGRLHRHARGTRPVGFQTPRVIVLVPQSRDLGKHIQESGQHAGHAWGPHGLGTVYEDLRVLEATWSMLRDRRTMQLPAENRGLVEATTHPEALEGIAQEKGGAWVEHARTMDGIGRARKGLADLNLADWTVRFGDPDSLFPDRPGERIKTRLGEGDRRAVLSRAVMGPFGKEIEELTIPAWMATEGKDDERAEVLNSGGDQVEFRFASERYRYDRLGLQRVQAGDPVGESS